MNNYLKNTKLTSKVYSSLFFFVILFPASMYLIKIALLGIIIVLKLFYTQTINKTLFKGNGVIFWYLIFVTANVFYICYGECRGNQALRFYFPIDVIWLSLYFLLFAMMDSEEYICVLNTIIFSVKLVFFIGIIAFILFNVTDTRELLNFKAAMRPGYPFLAISGGSITNVIFIGSVILLSCLEKREKPYVFIIELLFIIATSRRSLMLNVLIIFVLYIFLNICLVKEKKELTSINKLLKLLLIMVLAIVIGLILFDKFSEDFDLGDFLKFFKNAFKLQQSFEKNIDNSSFERGKQAVALYNGWLDHMLLGSGTAANAEIVRSDVPGAYELTYLAVLFQRGIIGMILYVFQFAFIFVYMIVYAKKYDKVRKFLLIYISSFLCFLIANGTNPYLQAFDFLWVLFIPLTSIRLLQKDYNTFIEEINRNYTYG